MNSISEFKNDFYPPSREIVEKFKASSTSCTEIGDLVYKPRRIFNIISKVFLLGTIAGLLLNFFGPGLFGYNNGLIDFDAIIILVFFYFVFLRIPLRIIRGLALHITDKKAVTKISQGITPQFNQDLTHQYIAYLPSVIALDTHSHVFFFQDAQSNYEPTFIHCFDLINAQVVHKKQTETVGKIEKGFFSDKIVQKTKTLHEEYLLEVFFQEPNQKPRNLTFSFGLNRTKADAFLYNLNKAAKE